MVEKTLFILRIYRHSEEEYNLESDRHVQREKDLFILQLKNLGIENDDKGMKRIENEAPFPYWKYNDIIGFIDIGIDIGTDLGADIFLKNKYLPKGHHNKSVGNTPIQNQQIHYFREMHSIKIDLTDNSVIIDGIQLIISESEKYIHEFFPKAFVSKPEIAVKNIDFARELSGI